MNQISTPNEVFMHVHVEQMHSRKSVVQMVHYHLFLLKFTKESDLPFIPKVQQGGFSVMFWGCFTRNAQGPLIVIEGKINGPRYLKLVQDVVIPEINASDHDLIFMQDNARPHNAKIVRDYYDENNVVMLDWPPQSPDTLEIHQWKEWK
jgi:hypothetical protein